MSGDFCVAVMGASGVVGRTMLDILQERDFPVRELRCLASKRSAGTELEAFGRTHRVQETCEEAFEGVDLALFSAGSTPSRTWGPVAAQKGALVIDNSSAWRMDPDVPLCVPEVNLQAARNPAKGIVANPNCSTIQMVMALAPIHREVGIRRIVVSTYQSVSGAGIDAVHALQRQTRAMSADDDLAPEDVLGGILAGDIRMHWARDLDSGYQEEELKLVHETRKILGDPSIAVSPTAVRVPSEVGHGEAIALEARRPIDADQVRRWLTAAPGVEVVDNFAEGVYPSLRDAQGRDEVLVGRIRNDVGLDGGVQLWVVGDNLRKGAALNAIQIAEGLLLAS